ncbi:hypothetical protein A9404_09860 [Halothiobacillus diazotrophicus]|uniref:Helix-hairpin-helix DNA-binding motif class 1 domain-containing protein n=1 Tax=Halothiobacillus diazotrophicus TaxID=1860122 RepID=A0A191ZIG7_9GAMM|nr:helix-hairpin-helix domain-containing protein [Halothiobacillus diazotrophicus]ANJ67643.1 hypothetical protein A9404_09860 [Halothiobacillus diazotrophicus]
MNMWIKSLVLIFALGAGSMAYAMDKVNLNTATVTQLESVKGIGPKLAGAIVAYRQAHHGFKSLDELKSVKGIGDKKYVKIKNAFSLGAMKSTKP